MKRQLHALRDFFRGEYGRFVWMTTAAFLAIAVLAYGAGRLFPERCESVVQYFADRMDETGVMDAEGAAQVAALFGNNLRAMVLSMLYGLIPFLFLPALSLGVNAILIGALGAYYANNGHSLLLYAAGILPHGIFELPALFLSLAGGLYLCRSLDEYIQHNEKGVMKPLLLNLLRVLCALLPLLLLAAVTETYVTPLAMAMFAE